MHFRAHYDIIVAESEVVNLEKIQWHPGFYAGMELELRSFRLDFQEEYQLSKGPLSVDLLIIKKHADEKIDIDFGEMFRKHNIVEFKSPEDDLNIDVFCKVQAYAALYKASGEQVNAIPMEEITVSLFRDSYPAMLIAELKKQGAVIDIKHPGVYRIERFGLFPSQVVVTRELNAKDHAPLRMLSNRVTKEDVAEFLKLATQSQTKGDVIRMDAILQVSASANQKIYQKIYKEEADMCQALREIMREDFKQAEAEGEVRMAELINRLYEDGRREEARLVGTDPVLRGKLYADYHIVTSQTSSPIV